MGKLKVLLPSLLIGAFLVFCLVEGSRLAAIKGNTILEYNRPEDVEKYTPFKFNIPESIKRRLDEEGYENIQLFGGSLVIIKSNKTEFRVAEKIDKWADPLGLDEIAENDRKFEVKTNKNDVEYIRFRNGYSDGRNAFTWNTSDLMYGVLIDKEVEFKELLSYIDIKESDLVEIEDSTSNKSLEQGEVKFIYISNKSDTLGLMAPEVKTKIDILESDKAIMFKIDSKLVMIVTSDLESKDSITDGYEMYETNDCILAILEDNPFEEESQKYFDFETIKNNLDRIIKSVENQKSL